MHSLLRKGKYLTVWMKGDKMKGYFEGWYFKQQNRDVAMALIPAVHRDKIGKWSASLQVITSDKSCVMWLPFTDVFYERSPLKVNFGRNLFSLDGIQVDMVQDGCELKGELEFKGIRPPAYDIMGPFSLIPGMQCGHSLFSMRHEVRGKLTLNGENFDFSQGSGYIEGDRGRSFPKEYLWTHCNFNHISGKGSIMLAVADIPMVYESFTGIIGFVCFRGKEYRFATYLGAKIQFLDENTVKVEQGSYVLIVQLLGENHQILRVPLMGDMSRKIKESLCCKVKYLFKYEGKPMLEFTTNRASFEKEYHKNKKW